MDNIRFRLDEDGDIVDMRKLKVYSSTNPKDWERLLILLNSLFLQKQKQSEKYEELVNIIREEYEEYNDYIDEYSLLKIDIIMDLAVKLNISLDSCSY